ncbi:MAG: argininosuccinate synthase [Planctomycetota bacterium]|nr:MAG: argininosuccinate synthase [Planctomycetota bacterium]
MGPLKSPVSTASETETGGGGWAQIRWSSPIPAGLDTSYCILALREQGWEVIAVTVDTGGFRPGELEAIGARARALGAREHLALDRRAQVYDRFVSWIIRGNVLRGGVYPLCVAAERVEQAIAVAEVARERGARAVAHGSTGAGNDQVRFDAAFRTLLPGTEVLAPIRAARVSRQQATARLRAAGLQVEERTTELSVNVSLWGTTIGGRELHDPWRYPKDDVWRLVCDPARAAEPREIFLRFEQGLPVALDDAPLAGIDLVARLNELAGARGVGRGVHLGDTILGIKGRIAFEAPAPLVLVLAHRELEKLVLTKWQQFWKDMLATFYGNLLHEGLYFDPVMRDIEALLASSQQRVTGEVRVWLGAGRAEVRGVRSPYTLVAPEIATYGEGNAYWDGADAAGFCKLFPLQAAIASWRAPGGQEER